ncbi:DUF4224 domain-containing protein [Oceanospirillaceae bacterium ASx5O]|nr:DUF4224 domain-containing protein [Oceanospirillaceae bacterium ASx5O]
MNEVLTEQDLQEITGYRQAKKQCDALQQKCIPFTQDRNGRPVLTWSVFNSALLRQHDAPPANDSGFNLGAIR